MFTYALKVFRRRSNVYIIEPEVKFNDIDEARIAALAAATEYYDTTNTTPPQFVDVVIVKVNFFFDKDVDFKRVRNASNVW